MPQAISCQVYISKMEYVLVFTQFFDNQKQLLCQNHHFSLMIWSMSSFVSFHLLSACLYALFPCLSQIQKQNHLFTSSWNLFESTFSFMILVLIQSSLFVFLVNQLYITGKQAHSFNSTLSITAILETFSMNPQLIFSIKVSSLMVKRVQRLQSVRCHSFILFWFFTWQFMVSFLCNKTFFHIC